MTEKEMIEEMVKVLNDFFDKTPMELSFEHDNGKNEVIEDNKFLKVLDDIVKQALIPVFCEALYNAGYRKVLHRIDDKNQVICGETFVPYKDAKMFINKAKKQAVKEFSEKLKEKFNDTEYRAKTKRKTISVEELKAQMDWILHEVVIKNIDETLKEFLGAE